MNTTTAITPKMRVRLYVSDCADKVTATVDRVYIDATDTEVAELTLTDGTTTIQCTRFLESAGTAVAR